ncbi:hypothetical protein N658DRAFT_248747 [Parathielavia hyrcaniae]|uniref:Rhodopsin domain-containing protein n=1 Tax=Parathielavia hyrcaniae TaxID=113614 RepID=A0AAN6T4T9_9PEZI|nr:hypothetical protein N658DRAFT_248747 [Parathielavia hyrcaniae]
MGAAEPGLGRLHHGRHGRLGGDADRDPGRAVAARQRAAPGVYVSEADYRYNNMLGYYTQISLFASSCLLKVSICLLLLLRIRDTRGLKLLLYAVMAGLVAANASCIVILLAQCDPVETYWTGTGGTCWDPAVRIRAFWATISYNILTDLLCSVFPLIAVWKIRIPLQTKLLISGLISLGLLATAFGVVRAVSLRSRASDLSWTYAWVSLWSSLELFIGIIAANLAISRSVYRLLRYGKPSPSNGGILLLHSDRALGAPWEGLSLRASSKGLVVKVEIETRRLRLRIGVRGVTCGCTLLVGVPRVRRRRRVGSWGGGMDCSLCRLR